MEEVAIFASILRRHVSLKILIGISKIIKVIRKVIINCNTDFTVYKFYCSSCSKQYVGINLTDFCYQCNNYKSAFRKVSKSCKPPKVNQEHFYQDFKLHELNGMDNWRATLIDTADIGKYTGEFLAV